MDVDVVIVAAEDDIKGLRMLKIQTNFKFHPQPGGGLHQAPAALVYNPFDLEH